jgi:hypothetical protein
MPSWRLLPALVAGMSVAVAPGCQRSEKRALGPGHNPAEVWLARIGTGPAQTARVCARGAADRFALALCNKTTPTIRGLEELYRVLRLDQPAEMLAATTIHSLGLSARTVSALNPRVLVFQNISDKSRTPTYEQVAAAGFARGEQLVELAALDPGTYDFNFYLLRFEQACNRTRCTPDDLLTEKIEHGWTSWTLYSDHDLEDTPLDCISCHRPFGPGEHRQFLMRQTMTPWMHWGHFRGGTERSLCSGAPSDGSAGQTVAVADGLDLLRAVEGAAGRYAGVSVAKLHAALSGDIFSSFVTDADGLVRLSPYGQRYNYPGGQTDFPTREVLCERFRTGASPTWEKLRRESRERGLNVPYYAPDVTDPQRRAEVGADRAAFLRRHADEDAVDVAAAFLAADTGAAVGFVPRDDETAPEILRAMCVRCHNAKTEPQLRRARFNADSIDRIDPVTATAVRRRLSLPRSSPELMPPVRVGELPGWAIARINRYLADHCADPGACG